MSSRREFVTLLGGAATAWPLVARVQPGERVRRIGMLTNLAENDPEERKRMAAFLQALQKLGWRDDDNVRIDYRVAQGTADNARRYAAELVALAPDVILASGSVSTGALFEATRAPIGGAARARRAPGGRRPRHLDHRLCTGRDRSADRGLRGRLGRSG